MSAHVPGFQSFFVSLFFFGIILNLTHGSKQSYIHKGSGCHGPITIGLMVKPFQL